MMILRQALEAMFWMFAIVIACDMIRWAVLRMLRGEQENKEED